MGCSVINTEIISKNLLIKSMTDASNILIEDLLGEDVEDEIYAVPVAEKFIGKTRKYLRECLGDNDVTII